MTALRAAAIASVVMLAAAGCTNFYEIPIETPIQAKLDVSPFQRVHVVGFIAGGLDDVDANLETVRLLRSQLRTRSNLRVIEADVLPLVEIAQEQFKEASEGQPAPPTPPPTPPVTDGASGGGAESGSNGGGAASNGAAASAGSNGSNGSNGQPAGGGQNQQGQQNQSQQQTPEGAQPQGLAGRIKDAKDLAAYERIFANVNYWKKLGEEFQQPLFVTGTIYFTTQQRSGIVTTQREVYDQLGRRVPIMQRVYMERRAFTLQPKFVFIDGRTGATLYTESFKEERLYAAQQNTPALSSYFEMMDTLIPSFLNTLSAQKIRGTRVLLK
jgi:hypothetical protein